MIVKIATLSKRGGRKENEDACDFVYNKGIYCYVLSDGLGGHPGGRVAAKLVVQHVLDGFQKTPECSVQAIEALLHVADEAIIQEQQLIKKFKQMRATAVVLTIDTSRYLAAWGHCGDSRLYCFRQGRIILQTRDHSLSQSMVDAGYLEANKLRFSPDRNQLYAALGDHDHFQADIIPVAHPVQAGDVFLMCSDGLWEYVTEEEMERMLSRSSSASAWLEAMEKQVLARGHKDQDNYSAIVVWCSDSDETILYA
ncbi:PP2C family protein-serine/threonine phosphatase [Nitrosomonas communis]|uniref:Serine/threonine protein phosphatase PrpC n=1 Tax=Nitrosomonas communis TaxID=44574 RepID=A0A1H2V4W5_9PROT|nr:PP2C family serine/threonine-protein phosphatase [Nitrosomonas communis]SDW63353.1 Serine/threonine protein phosphatase PrpC [Nitrosomonas communis]